MKGEWGYWVELCPPQNVHVLTPQHLERGPYLEIGSVQMGPSEGSEMRSSWIRGALNPMTVSSSETEEQGHRQRGDTTWRRRQRWEGGGHQPRDAWSPQELEGAGGTVPWGPQREPGPGTH